MYFSPAYLASLLVEPLRYYFKQGYAGSELVWSEDPKESNIEIDTVNNFNKLPLQVKPRILVNRGDFRIAPSGLTDNLAEASWRGVPKGTTKKTNLQFIEGQCTILVYAKNEGTCEKVLENVLHFITWTAPYIAGTQGFKKFAYPLTVSSVVIDKEDTELFKCAINVPYYKEEEWVVENDGIELKNFLLSLSTNS